MDKQKKLYSLAKEIDIELSDVQINQFIMYYEILVEWNTFMNLTGITEYEEVISKHFIDSLLITKHINMSKYHTMIDVGTGAGFPGIPLKILYPEMKVTLLDSLKKRIKFLDEVIEKLNLHDIRAIHGRAEDYGRDVEYREKYDLCLSRAVANLSTLSEYCMPFVKTNGYFIPYKAGKIEEEVSSAKNAVKLLGGSINTTILDVLPRTDIERTFIVIHKDKSTNKKYPRLAGKPSKEPL